MNNPFKTRPPVCTWLFHDDILHGRYSIVNGGKIFSALTRFCNSARSNSLRYFFIIIQSPVKLTLELLCNLVRCFAADVKNIILLLFRG